MNNKWNWVDTAMAVCVVACVAGLLLIGFAL